MKKVLNANLIYRQFNEEIRESAKTKHFFFGGLKNRIHLRPFAPFTKIVLHKKNVISSHQAIVFHATSSLCPLFRSPHHPIAAQDFYYIVGENAIVFLLAKNKT